MPFCSRLVLGDYHEAIDKLCASCSQFPTALASHIELVVLPARSFNGHGDRTSVSKAGCHSEGVSL